MTDPLPFLDLKAQYLRLKPRIDARIQAVLDHGQFILGPEVQELEAALARFSGAAHAVAVSCGTDALIIALSVERIGRRDAVFLPGFTFAATAEAVIAVGATPVFCEVDPTTFNLDPAGLERRLAEVNAAKTLRPRAVIPVDLFGLPANYSVINEIADHHRLCVIADAAQSFGASMNGTRVGRLATLTATSFFPSKPLGCFGDGGCLFTDDAERAAVMAAMRVHGEGPDGRHQWPGINARLDTLQAAVLLAKLETFEADIAARAAVAKRYNGALEGRVAVPSGVAGATSAWAIYSVLVEGREAVRQALAAEGIPSRIYYPEPLHLEPAFSRYGGGSGSLPVCENLSTRILSLPMYPELDEADVDRICDILIRVLR